MEKFPSVLPPLSLPSHEKLLVYKETVAVPNEITRNGCLPASANASKAVQATPRAEIAKQPNRPIGRLGSRTRSRPHGGQAQVVDYFKSHCCPADLLHGSTASCKPAPISPLLSRQNPVAKLTRSERGPLPSTNHNWKPLPLTQVSNSTPAPGTIELP